MSNPVVVLEKVTKQYKQLLALNEIDLTLDSGEVLGLFGHNGAGKTTMMKLILGIIPATKGHIEVCGVDPKSKQAWHSRKSIGYLPENVSFYDQLTGQEVLTYFSRLKSEPTKHIPSLLQKVGLDHAAQRQVKTYSKGMRQRLGLAQAFLGKPKLLLLDEPTVGLDPIATQEFYSSVDQLKNDGASIILCSHALSGVEQHIDRAMILSSGHPIAMGTLEQLRQHAQLPVIIKAKGINRDLANDRALAPYLVSTDQLHIPEHLKMTTLKALLTHAALEDVQIENANLEQIYQHFLQQAEQQTNHQREGQL
ncbi:copper ABC transporter ATP-binding protein [Vibrio sp. MACH09]|uniref:ABC transporter ATP-binding protein n=1 Tax=Vibrio sp. MACH09 TaxID=3025122 RepID=UPI0027926098|nr:ABC transporter ATP-binding protein [Vibrio sp. MACH09]GLO61910.1 copper ABC transporter ATP-binding protein [Vibrio sp. MACH09]